MTMWGWWCGLDVGEGGGGMDAGGVCYKLWRPIGNRTTLSQVQTPLKPTGGHDSLK